MGKLIIEIKRPDEATPERALALWKAGVKVHEMSEMWHISRPYIYYLLKLAGWTKGTAR